MASTPDSLHTRIEQVGDEWVLAVDIDGRDRIDSRHGSRADAEAAEQALHASVRKSVEASDDRAS